MRSSLPAPPSASPSSSSIKDGKPSGPAHGALVGHESRLFAVGAGDSEATLHSGKGGEETTGDEGGGEREREGTRLAVGAEVVMTAAAAEATGGEPKSRRGHPVGFGLKSREPGTLGGFSREPLESASTKEDLHKVLVGMGVPDVTPLTLLLCFGFVAVDDGDDTATRAIVEAFVPTLAVVTLAAAATTVLQPSKTLDMAP
ncbi:hypothetical protein BHE74_00033585 [Ensete ventricosum]|nr:hypothetical protein BHE74_00033585 [Ensete ventricosum]RZS25670.1 hypothetical protein BHM03_00058903 [Ensete ventricosum]